MLRRYALCATGGALNAEHSRLYGALLAGISYGLRQLGILISALLLWGCPSPGSERRPSPNQSDVVSGSLVTSNILRGDYAGSVECSDCHSDIYNAWLQSPMHRMTRNSESAVIRAPFSGTVFRFKGDQVVMEKRDGHRYMRLRTRAKGESLYRITRVIGGRYREDFVGIDVSAAENPATDPGRGEERIMPVSYVFATNSWRYKGYSVLVKERPRLQVAGVWRERCIFCHNTVPHLSTLFDDLLKGHHDGYQGSAINDLLPPSRRWEVVPTDPMGLAKAVVEEVRFLGGKGSETATVEETLANAIRTTRRRFGPQHFIEIGIGCESCHGGAREHVENPRHRPTFEVRSNIVNVGLAAATGTPSRAQWINRTCMRCHTVLFSRYPHTWEGGRRYGNPGGSNMNSGEARDFALGACSSQLSCTRCHNPHAEDTPDALARLTGWDGNRVCSSCHKHLATREAVAEHSHHDPDQAGSSCIACHMPRKNLGLGYRLTRYHRIGTPADAVRVEQDRPLECALCHTDKSVASIVETMERWWDRKYDRRRLRQLYGNDLAVFPLRATIHRGKPHEQVVAIAVLGEAGDPGDVGLIAKQLTHAYPLVRYYAAQALADIKGEWPIVDLNASSSEIHTQFLDWLRTRK